MKSPNDTQTEDMLPDGWPAFDINPEDPWPMPKPAEPEKTEALKPFKEWARRMLETRL